MLETYAAVDYRAIQAVTDINNSYWVGMIRSHIRYACADGDWRFARKLYAELVEFCASTGHAPPERPAWVDEKQPVERSFFGRFRADSRHGDHLLACPRCRPDSLGGIA